MLFSSIHNRINQKHFRKRTSRKTAAQKWTARRWSFEQLENRMLLSATVWTDRPDYLPGSSAGIFGSGFGAAEAVTVKVQHNNDGYMDGPYAWQVTSLTDGSFQTQWTVVNELNSSYTLSAMGQTSGLTAQTTFMDGSTITDVQGWENLVSPSGAWGGTLQGSNSNYSESGWVPYRFVDTSGEAAASTHTLVLKYDFTDSQGVHFIDSLGSFNNTITSGVDPTTGATGLSSPSTFSIPIDTSLPTSVQNLDAAPSAHVLTAYNISNLSFGTYSLASGQKAITLTYTVAGLAGSGNKEIVIAFGGHLANDNDWGGTGTGASSFPGGSGKVYASLDSASFKNASLNPGQVITNAAPIISSNNSSVTVNEGQTATNTGSYSDPNGNTVAITASVGIVTKTGTSSGTWSWSFNTTDGPAQSQTVTITANDGKGGISTTTFGLTVNNVPPVVTAPANQASSTNVSASFNLGSFSDAGVNDNPWAADVNWGDSTAPTTFSQLAQGSLGTRPHTYALAGIYTVTVQVTDKDGGVGSSTFQVTVSASSTTTTVTSSANPSTYGQSVAFTATVSSGSGTPTGTVQFQIDSTAFGAPVTLSGGIATSAAIATLTAGTHTITGVYSGSGSFSGSSGSLIQTVNPRPITVTADAKTKVYGTADPALSYQISSGSLVNGDSFSGGLTRAAGENVAGNPYAISQGTLAANSNYTISFTGNNLTIIARSITVTVNNHIKVFGTTDPALTFSVGGSGLAVGDTQATVFSGSLTRAAGENVGMYAITQGTLVANSNYSITAFTTGQLTITPAPTTATVTVTPASVQYSDIVNFSAVLSPDSTGGQSPATSVTFKIGTQTMGTATLVASGGMLTGTLASPVQVLMAPGSYTVTAQFGGKNSNFTVTDPTTPLTVTQEDARVTYTGALVVVTQSITTYTATVTLRATVQDITAVPSDPAYDPYAGDIRNATVTFVNRDTNTVLGTVGFGTPTPIVLVNPGDSKTGTVALPVTFTIPSSGSGAITPTIGIIVGYNGAGYYTRNSSADNAVITVALPIGTGFITGGGYLVMQSPAGQYAGDIGTNENFGFNVKSKHSGTNFQGNFNSIVRQNGHVYQIKSNSIASLSVDSNVYPGHPYPTAVFLSKANLNDITDPNNSIGIQGNLSLQVTMTDAGEPGNSDSISITLWNGSALWVSSHWTGTTTVEQLLSPGNGNGNLVVHQLQVLLGTPVSGQGGGEALTPEMLQPFIAEALARWQAAGFTSEQLSTVKDINFQVADLPAGNLGWTTAAGSIILDRNAAGYGWFIDPTPADDAEFAAGVMNSPAQDHVDLLTVVTHEIGHVLGFPDDHGGGLMDEALPVGVRRVPFSSIVFPSIGSTDLQRILQAEPDRFSLSTNILAALTAGQREGFSLPSTPVVTGQKYDANPLYSQSLLLLSSAGEEVAWTAVAQATPPASAGRAFMRVLDHVFAEEARLLQQTLLDDLGLALEG